MSDDQSIKNIKQLLARSTDGLWNVATFTKPDGSNIQSVDDAIEAVAYSLRQSEKSELWGVSLLERDPDGDARIICYTGNGPNSKGNAEFLANAKDAIKWLLEHSSALQQEVARLREELEHEQMRGDGWATTAENYKNQAESAESSLLAMREALEAVIREADRDTPGFRMARAALSTSAQAEGIKARWQAEALTEAISEIPDTHCYLTGGDDNLTVRWLRARAAQITAKIGGGDAESGA